MRYLIVEKDKGVFLGSVRSSFLFAKYNIFPVVKAPSFDSEASAEYYIENYLPKEDRQYGVIQIDVTDKYVSIVDIIKQGYAEYTHELIDFMPMQSEAIH